MKRSFILLLLFQSIVSFSQEKKISIESIEHIKTAGNFQFGLGLVEYDPQLGLGSSAYFSLSNLKNKFSLEGNYNYTYFGKKNMKSAEIMPVDKSTFINNSIDFGIGYTFKQSAKNRSIKIRLTKDTITSSYKHNYIKSEAIRIGYYAKNFGFRYDQKNSEKEAFRVEFQPGFSLLINDAMLHQRFKMIYVGVSIKESINERFLIEKYGERKVLIEKEWLFDLLINVGNELLPFYYNGNSTIAFTDEALKNAINDKLTASPIGVRMAKRYSKGHEIKFGYEIFGGFYPMYRASIFQSFIVGAKVNLRFIKPFKK